MRTLRAVPASDKPLDMEPESIAQECVEGLTRACVERRAWLKRELAAEDARFSYLRRRLADQRGVAFIRTEQAEREFRA